MKQRLLAVVEVMGTLSLAFATLGGFVGIGLLVFGFHEALHGSLPKGFNALKVVLESILSIAYPISAWLHWLRPRQIVRAVTHLGLALGMCGASATAILLARGFLLTDADECGNPVMAAWLTTDVALLLACTAVMTISSAGLRAWLDTSPT
jgi:hypothetical protein